MKRIFLVLLLSLLSVLCIHGCGRESSDKHTLSFTFETLSDSSVLNGSSYFMNFGSMEAQKDAVITEGKLLSVFGEPAYKSENYENSFSYIIRAVSDDGRSVILNVYGVGAVHIGALQQDEFSRVAAEELIEYVSAAEPSDFERTVYYLDFNMQIDISLKNGIVSIKESQISAEKALELFNEWYN